MNYGNLNVDERYSSIVEPNLYADNIFEPGITYNDAYQGDANSGLVKIYREVSDGVVGADTPAGDFTDEAAKNELLDLRLNNAFRKSKKIYKVAANSVSYQLADQTLSTAVKDCQQGEMAAGLVCLVHEGKDLGDTTAITSKNVKSMILKARVKARKGKASPNVVLASVDVFSAMLEAAGDQFTPIYNDETVRTGQVGYWLGMLWKEANALENSAANYYDYAGTKQTEDLTKVDFVMYDWKAFHKVDNLEEIRVIDSENFVGSKAQVEFNDGFRVSNKDRVIVKKKSLADGEMKDNAGISDNLSPVDAETDCYGKQTSELGTVAFDGKILSGTLNKVTGYTGFNESVVEEQSGYYLPFLYDGADTLKMYVKTAEKQATVDKAPTVNVAFLGADKATAEKAVLHLVKEDGAMTEVYMTGITFNEGE